MTPPRSDGMTPTRSEEKRAAILEAARRCFQERGYHGTSVDLVAERAGVSKRTIYNHFESKDGLFHQVASDLFGQSWDATAIEYDPAAPLAAQLERFARAKIALSADEAYIGLFRAVIADFARSPELARSTLESLRRGEESLVSWVRAAQSDGRLRGKDPRVPANHFWSLIKGEVFWPLIAFGQSLPGKAEQKRIVRDAIALFLAHHGVG